MIAYVCYFHEKFLFSILEYFMYIRLEFFSIPENFLDFFYLDISIRENIFKFSSSNEKRRFAHFDRLFSSQDT
jgi:hypothetical protein